MAGKRTDVTRTRIHVARTRTDGARTRTVYGGYEFILVRGGRVCEGDGRPGEPGAGAEENVPEAGFRDALTVSVDGSLNSTASASHTIELYANPLGSEDQGHQYICGLNVTTDAGCNATFTTTIAFIPPADGWTITATAIDAANNTSDDVSSRSDRRARGVSREQTVRSRHEPDRKCGTTDDHADEPERIRDYRH